MLRPNVETCMKLSQLPREGLRNVPSIAARASHRCLAPSSPKSLYPINSWLRALFCFKSGEIAAQSESVICRLFRKRTQFDIRRSKSQFGLEPYTIIQIYVSLSFSYMCIIYICIYIHTVYIYVYIYSTIYKHSSGQCLFATASSLEQNLTEAHTGHIQTSCLTLIMKTGQSLQTTICQRSPSRRQ